MTKKPAKSQKRASRADPNRYPKGWDRKRVQALVEYYETQSDEEAIAELNAAFDNEHTAIL